MRVYHCLTCSDHPRFERDQAIAHLAEHGIGVNVVARRRAAVTGRVERILQGQGAP